MIKRENIDNDFMSAQAWNTKSENERDRDIFLQVAEIVVTFFYPNFESWKLHNGLTD